MMVKPSEGAINVDDYFKENHQWMKNLVPKFVAKVDTVEYHQGADETDVDNLARANVITSKDESGNNYLMLDLDDPEIYLRLSSTEGHYHLVFPNKIPDGKYYQIITLLNDVGIIKDGNLGQYSKNGHFALRTPWVPKGKTAEMRIQGLIGPNSPFDSDEEALSTLQDACAYLGVEFPNEVYQQMNAKLVAEKVDIPDTPPVDWN